MLDDYKMWDIDQLLGSYINAPDMAASVRQKMESLFLFLERNSLLKCKVSDGSGNIARRSLMRSELTEEGTKLASGPKNPVHRWLGSKASQKNPPDMKLLEKALAEIRAGK
ncbi:Uncharacterised protein [Serratia liquefaciens]|jgi:hypothetical protein|uniref:hypothetical protein n=1 Tax=Serratia liquefaciens TaxID=614 RepID=UPI0003583B89|nr:hypothetical protein [Serratia liquefaciens]AGQ33540.1 hypothetical protein M495_24805 [Serratia liquefaciens ATCC 27592]CAI1074488.1 Uncharacterised protein [Serratia liquefaciens]CAI1098720.1 Uncharacterised protein [Serratia liquefaciens]CAI1156614.1 Uncharacterised protein [Serratia liquefaciens]CAI2147499.1 Uncharacterised protein [Serratia liquefaciens]